MKSVKDDTRQRILDAAQEEFLLSGYRRASMRTIAAQAGMTVGNIYLHFAGKEQLLDAIVGDTVSRVQAMVSVPGVSDENVQLLVGALHDVFIQSRVPFLILITRSEGSKYETLKDTIIKIAERRMTGRFADARDERICGPLAVAVIEGLLQIFNQFEGDEAQLMNDLSHFLNYMLRGRFATPTGEP